MPLMLDGDMDMDDLFGDGAGLSLSSRPPTKELYQRVDELRASGCCQGIAWSKWGSIAAITPDGSAIELRNLRCHPSDGNWALSEPTTTPPFTQTLDGGPLKHLSWSPTGSELAVIDAAGRVTILGLFSSLNKPTLHRPAQADSADDLHRVVGSYWLNLAPVQQNRPKMQNGPGIKEGAGYRYEASQAPVLGPCHPNHAKSAFVCVTTNGLLRVIWPQNNGKWFESHTELESIVSSDDLITHAAICPDKAVPPPNLPILLVAFATTSKQLRTVRALIDWNQPKANEKIAPALLPLNPTIKTRHLAVTSWAQETSGNSSQGPDVASSMAQLSHLEFLYPCGDPSGRITPPTVVAIRSCLPVSASHYNQEVHTTIDRWEVREKPQTIHAAFEQLSSRRNSVGSQPGPVHYLKKLENFTVNKVALAVQTMNLGKVIFIAYHDSSVEYRDRTTMAETFNDNNLNRVWHLSQIGFTYSEDDPCLHVALSPSYASVVQIRNDGKVQWKRLDYLVGDIGSSMEDPQYAAVVAVMALTCASAVMRNVNYDDLLATAHKHAKGNFSYDWLTELARIFKINSDYSEETHYDVLIRNTSIQLCLCIQNSLGFRGGFNARTFAGKFAWLVLQLRSIVVLVTMAANLNVQGSNPNEKSSPLEDPEVINSLAGSVRWVLDLMAWLVDTLLTLPTTLPEGLDLSNVDQLSLPVLLDHLRTTNTVSLHLLLSSPTRGFLTAICRRLAHLDYIARKAIMLTSSSSTNTPNPQKDHPGNQSSSPSPALRAAYLQIATLTSSTILRIKTFENLLLSLTSLIKTAYSNSSPPLSGSQTPVKQARNALEIKMLFGGEFPDAFKTVIVELFRKEGLLDGVRDEIEPAKLFFADFGMLEVDEDEDSVKKRKNAGVTMDCFRKAWLVNPKKETEKTGTAGEQDAVNGVAGENTGQGQDVSVSMNLGLIGTGGKQGARWRRCARCASVMEDVLTPRQQLQWMVMQQRRCFCSGWWDTLGPGDLFA